MDNAFAIFNIEGLLLALIRVDIKQGTNYRVPTMIPPIEGIGFEADLDC